MTYERSFSYEFLGQITWVVCHGLNSSSRPVCLIHDGWTGQTTGQSRSVVVSDPCFNSLPPAVLTLAYIIVLVRHSRSTPTTNIVDCLSALTRIGFACRQQIFALFFTYTHTCRILAGWLLPGVKVGRH